MRLFHFITFFWHSQFTEIVERKLNTFTYEPHQLFGQLKKMTQIRWEFQEKITNDYKSALGTNWRPLFIEVWNKLF